MLYCITGYTGFILQTYLLWAHSKDCIHRHKIITRCITMSIFHMFNIHGNVIVAFVFLTFLFACMCCRSGLMVILSADLVLWLNAVTEDTIHEEIELEKEDRLDFSNINSSEADSSDLAGRLLKRLRWTHAPPP